MTFILIIGYALAAIGAGMLIWAVVYKVKTAVFRE